ncbi:unnamed protein product, partial [Closterium sp. NIES-54]
ASESAAALGASEADAALGASESAAAFGDRASPAIGPSFAEALHTSTLDSDASRCFFRDCTTLTPLAALVPVSLADPTGGPVVTRASTVLPCLAVPSGSLSGLHLPTFSTNLVSNAAIQDVWVDTFILGGQRVAICMCSRTSRHLATFTRQPRSSLYTLTTVSAQVAEAGQVAASSRVSASGQLAASCSYQECYFLLVVDDYARYTTVFPLRRKADVSGVLIPWIRATRRQLRERFCGDLLVLRLHPDRGETSPTLRWTGKVGDASVFRFYHPRSRRVFSSQDVTFDESVWLLRPPGFTGSFPAGTQWSLRRPVYGLCQAPREWHDTPRTTLAALGFAPSTADPSLFLRTDTTLPPFYVLVYVNDLDFATADTEALALVKAELQERHTCTYLGELCSYLGLQIICDSEQRTITLTQSHMVHQALQRFGFQFSSPQPTPLSTRQSLSAPPSDESVEPS